MKNISIEIYNTLEQTESIWVGLQKIVPHLVFQKYEWISCWFHSIGFQHCVPVVIVASDVESMTTVAIFHTAVFSIGGVRKLSFMGSPFSDYQIPLINYGYMENNRDVKLGQIWESGIAKIIGIDVVHLHNLPEKIYEMQNVFIQNLKINKTDTASRIKILESWEKFYNRRVTSTVKNIYKRKRKSLNKEGTVEIADVEISEYPELLKILLMYKAERLTGKEKKFFSSEVACKFLNDVCMKLPDSMVLTKLSLNGIPVALHLGIIDGKNFVYYIPAFDESYGKFSPGRILLEFLMERTFENSYEFFDFSIGGEEYKKDYFDEEISLYEHYKPVKWKGMVYCWLLTIRKYFKSNQAGAKIYYAILDRFKKL